MATKITTSFGSGGSGLTPNDSQGTPTLVTMLRDSAETMRAIALGAALSTAARRQSANGPFVFTGGKRLTVDVGGVIQNIDFVNGDFVNHAAATDIEVVTVLNDPIRGLRHARCVSVAGPKVQIDSEEVGASASLNVMASTAATALTLVLGAVAGTGIDVSPVKG
jgi:hypothetical protein